MTRATDLPEFERPPVVEVALGVQFVPLLAFGSKHVALLWERWRAEFPIWEEQAPLQPVTEWFGVTGQPSLNFRFDFGALPPLRRALFFSEDRRELRQVQADRFARNWTKTGDPYPRYDDSDAGSVPTKGLRTRFREDLQQFHDFVNEQGLGEFIPTQCEITYVNHIPATGELGARDMAELLSQWNGNFSDTFLQPPESIEISSHFVLEDSNKKNVGRLHVTAAPARDQTTGDALLRLTLTARGLPLGKGLDGVLYFLDLGRRHIVKGFASLTTPTMHSKWRRKNGG